MRVRWLMACLAFVAVGPSLALAAERPAPAAPGHPVFKASQGTRTMPPLVARSVDEAKRDLSARRQQAELRANAATAANAKDQAADIPHAGLE